VLNLAEQSGETDGFSAAEHLEVLADHAPDLRLAVVLADESAVAAGTGAQRSLLRAAESAGARLVQTPLAAQDGSPRHDVTRLAAALSSVVRDRPSGP